jgi:chitodextrinase
MLREQVRILVIFAIVCVLCGAVAPAAGAVNNPPVADTYGPYHVHINEELRLDGSGSYDTDAGDSVVAYAWDLDNDGIFDDAIVASPVITWAELRPMLQEPLVGTRPISLQVTDTFGLTGTAATALTVYDPRPLPFFIPNPNPAAAHQAVTFDASFSSHGSPYHDIVLYTWNFGDGTTGSGSVVTHTFATAGDYQPILTVTDDRNQIAKWTGPTITIVPGPAPGPVAVPGGPYTAPLNTPVALDGRGSYDPNGGTIDAYDWDIDNDGIFDDATGSVIVISMDMEGRFVPRLRVTDKQQRTGTAGTWLMVYGVPAASFTASPGPAAPGEAITFDASSSSSGSSYYNIILYEWDFGDGTAGSGVSAMHSHSYASEGSYTATLTVTDNNAPPRTATTSRVISVVTPNVPPIADPGGPYAPHVGDLVTLDGSGSSDPDGNYPLTYAWTLDAKPAGSAATLIDPDSAGPWFIADTAGDYSLSLVVTDALRLSSAPGQVLISTVNLPPVADPGGPYTPVPGDLVTLDGSRSTDPEKDYPLTYVWTLDSKPVGSTAAISDPGSVTPSVVVDKAGMYSISLVVTDAHGLASEPALVILHISPVRPTANAGPDQSFTVPGTEVHLDGTLSFDPDGDPLTYTWTITGRPAGSSAALSDPTSPVPSFIADVRGEYVITLVVMDLLGDLSEPDSVTVTLTNEKPVADAGLDKTVPVGTTVTLDGSGSHDANGDPLTYAWEFTGRPAGSTATLSDPADQKPKFTADKPGDYAVQLIVNDGYVDSDPATVMVHSEELTVAIDIEPGLCPNLLGLNMKGPLLVVAIPGTKVLDARKIDPASILLSRSDGVGGTVKPSLKVVLDIATPYTGTAACGCQRKLWDGTKDLVLVFDIGQVVTQLQLKGVTPGTMVPFTVRGTLKAAYGTTPITGSDCIKVLSISNERIRQGV